MTYLLKEILNNMRNADSPQEREAWLNHLKEILNASDFFYDPVLDIYKATIKYKIKVTNFKPNNLTQ